MVLLPTAPFLSRHFIGSIGGAWPPPPIRAALSARRGDQTGGVGRGARACQVGQIGLADEQETGGRETVAGRGQGSGTSFKEVTGRDIWEIHRENKAKAEEGSE